MTATNAEIRAQEILRRCVDHPIGAEIGVRIGVLSAELLKHCAELYMVDSWADGSRQPQHYRDTGDPNAHRSKEKSEKQKAMALQAVSFAGDRAKILHMTSAEAASIVWNGTLDFVFIDADHSYEGCSQDIELWTPKLKPGGLLCGHDYNHERKEFHGVTRAVDEAFARHGWKLELGENYTWFRA